MMWMNLSTLISNLYLKLLYTTKYVSLTFNAYQFRDQVNLNLIQKIGPYGDSLNLRSNSMDQITLTIFNFS